MLHMSVETLTWEEKRFKSNMGNTKFLIKFGVLVILIISIDASTDVNKSVNEKIG